ncbi:hypothetical protein FQN57_003173 [Myotisia sp. PD_48]|nr:hypothetical protein FQN57_003173 [Myotisia sp. PD_48]
MAGFGSNSFGGFGSNNPQQNPGFGSTGFGNAPSGTGFGSTASPFGNTSNTGNTSNAGGAFAAGSGGFGTGGGFGATTAQPNPIFGGQSRGFGTTPTSSSTGTFGTNTQNTAFAAPSFGTSGGFGSSPAAGSSVFGTKPTGFGTSGQGGSVFGGSTAPATAGTGFGTTPSTGFGTSGAATGGLAPAEGTANPVFSAHVDKDSPGSTTTNHYQSICFMQPYQKYSFEELRVADYNHGRRYGNASGQAGAFGSFSGFGQGASNFGAATTSSPFGATTSAPSAFGSQTQTSGFGSTAATNPLFGAAKPSPGLFGQTSNATQPSGFGTAGSTGGFGSSTGSTFGSNPQGGLFGNSQQKSPFGSTPGLSTGFGGQAASSGATAFGGTASTTTTTPFGTQPQAGGTSGFGPFGQQNQTQNKSPFSTFGQSQQQQAQQQPPGGALFGGTGSAGPSSLFGSNSQQGTSLFGQQSNPSNNLFGLGAQQNQQQQAQKPGGLFSGLGTNTSGTGTSGFGGLGTQATQPGGSLFGNQQQKPGAMFGPSSSQGTGLFNQSAAPSTGGSLFSPASANQGAQQGSGLGLGANNLFGQSQQQQQPQATGFQASLLDGNPYGSQSIFSGLPPPNTPSPGPLATPLSASIKQKQRTPLPMYKISPNAANRLVTPPTRQGYGFTYSTYGTPASIATTPTSGNILGGSLRGGSLGRSFGKSQSTSNLRKTWDPERDSILSPGAFSTGSSRSSGSSLKRLTIDRSLRTDLFSRSPKSSTLMSGEESISSSKLKKKVSFDDTATPHDLEIAVNGAVVRVETESAAPTPEELGFLRSARKQALFDRNGVVSISQRANGTENDPSTPALDVLQPEQVRGKELTPVPEHGQHGEPATPQPKLVTVPSGDPKPGEFWMKPSRAEITKMTREQKKQVAGFTVGRVDCGCVTFDRPVDLSAINLDDIFDKLVKISIRSITVYPDQSTKPPMGKGLNVPSTLRIENSWPRGKDRRSPSPLTSGPTFDKHIERLKQVRNTEFIDYEKETGTWVFTVPHYTTYGFDYDDNEGESLDPSLSSALHTSATPIHQTPTQSSMLHAFDAGMSVDSSLFGDSTTGIEDDTFEFKKRKVVPGAFMNQDSQLRNDLGFEEEDGRNSFLDEGSTGSFSNNSELHDDQDSAASEFESNRDEEMDMAGSFPLPNQTVELIPTIDPYSKGQNFLKSMAKSNSPINNELNVSGNWAQQLQRTISPRKQDRHALRDIQDQIFLDKSRENTPTVGNKKTMQMQPPQFTSSIDLMNSLFGQPRQRGASTSKVPVTESRSGLEWPYPRNTKTFAGKPGEMSESDVMFHHSIKPRWGPLDELILAGIESPISEGGLEASTAPRKSSIVIQKLDKTAIESLNLLQLQRAQTAIIFVDNTPLARLAEPNFASLAQSGTDNAQTAVTERWIWHLADILFNNDLQDDISDGVPLEHRSLYQHRIKKDRLTRLWEAIICHSHPSSKIAKTPEERAFLSLCFHRVEDACKILTESGNPHLATLVSQIGRDHTTKAAMRGQIDSWLQANIASEMNEPIRAIYELLAGNCLRSEGKPTGPPEDRVSTFNLSSRFDLDWVQAFGLRLWYGISDDDPLEAAVSLFHHDISHRGEPELPLSVNVKHLNGQDPVGQESPLWVLLKAYTLSVSNGSHPEIAPIPLPEAILPTAVCGHQLHHRLTFQLFHHLSKLPGKQEAFHINTMRADQLAWDFAWELTTLEQYAPACFVLLHLSQPKHRERSVKEILSRFAPYIPEANNLDGTPNPLWQYLVLDLELPPAWIWVPKALYARNSGDIVSEVDYLIRGKHWNEAHETFYRVVAPKMLIERDYDTLSSLLDGFGENPDRKVRGWADGGAIYQDFLRLVNAKGGWRDSAQLKRLLKALSNHGNKVENALSSSLSEKIAFREMSRMVAGWVTRDVGNNIESFTVLNLPLTHDSRIIHTAEISRRYYKSIMAGGTG